MRGFGGMMIGLAMSNKHAQPIVGDMKSMTRKRRMLRCLIAAGMALWVVNAPAQEPEPPDGSEKPKPAGSSTDEKASKDQPPDPGAVRTPAQPSPEDIIKAFQRDRPINKPIRPRTPRTATEGSLNQASREVALLYREGEYLNDVVGRLARDGLWWTLVFESDAPLAPRPPMRLLPNQQLERMVRESEASPESIVYVVSGEVTVFGSDNFLLLRKTLRRRSMGNLEK